MESREVLVAEQLASLSLRDDKVTIIDSVSLRQTDDRATGQQLSSAKDPRSSSVAISKLQVDNRLKEIEEADHEKNKTKNQANAGRASLTSSSPTPSNRETEVDGERHLSRNYDRNDESIDSFINEPVQTILIESVRRPDWSPPSEAQASQMERDGQSDVAAAAELDPPTCRGPVGGLAVAYQIPSDYGVSARFGAGAKRHYDYAYSPEAAVAFTSTSHDDGGGSSSSTFEQPSKFYRPVPVESEDGFDDDGSLLPELSSDLDDLLTQVDLEEFLGHHALDNFDDLLPMLKMFAGDDVPNPALPLISAQQSQPMFISPGHQQGAYRTDPITSTPLSFPNLSLGATKQHVQIAGNVLPEVSTSYDPNPMKNISWDGVRPNGFVPNSISDSPPAEFQSSDFNGNDVKPCVPSPRVPPQGSPQIYGNSGMQGSPVHSYGQMKVEVDADMGMTVLPQTSPFLSNPPGPYRPYPTPAMNEGAGAQRAAPMAVQPSLLPPYAVSRMPITTTAPPATASANAASPNGLNRLQYSAAQKRTG